MSPLNKRKYSATEIETMTEEVLLESRAMANLPINPLVVAQARNIKVLSAEFLDPKVSGAIVKAGNGSISVYVNEKDGKKRQRFTIAHELGHLLLHLENQQGNFTDKIEDDQHLEQLFLDLQYSQGNFTEEQSGEEVVMYRDKAHGGQQEIEANQFAAAFLMPKPLVIQHWDKGTKLGGMARLFDVSEISMRYRLNNLGLL